MGNCNATSRLQAQVSNLEDKIKREQEAREASKLALEKEEENRRKEIDRMDRLFKNLQERSDKDLEAERMERDALRRRFDSVHTASVEEKKKMEDQIKDKEARMESLRVESNKEMKKMREKHDTEKKKYESKLLEMNEKMLDEEKAHAQKIDDMNRELQKVYNGAYQMMLAYERNANEQKVRMLTENARALTAVTGMLHSIKGTNQVQIDYGNVKTRVDDIVDVVKAMENIRMNMASKLLHGQEKNPSSTGESAVAKGMAEITNDYSKLNELIKEIVRMIRNVNFDKNVRQEVKNAILNLEQLRDALYQEILTIKDSLDDNPKSVTTDGIKERLDQLRSAVDGFPPMPGQSVDEYITEQEGQIGQMYEEISKSIANSTNGSYVPSIVDQMRQENNESIENPFNGSSVPTIEFN